MVIILSMHRSGSSLLAGMLSDCGLRSGNDSDLIAASKDNEKGYIEHRGVVEVNEQILEQGKHNSSFPNFLTAIHPSTEQAETIANVANEINQNSIELIKDPRMCLTFSHWAKHFKNVKVIYLTRNPIQVAKSLNKRQKYPITAGLALWEYYNYKALESCTGMNIKHVHFDDITSDPETALKDIFGWLEKPIHDLDFSFLDSNLIHQKTPLDLSILSESQLFLYNSLTSKKAYSGPYNSTSMRRTLSLVNELVNIGYSPHSGQMKDPITQKNEERLISEKTKQKEFLSQKIDYWQTLSESRLSKINSQASSIESQSKTINNQHQKINSLIAQSKEWGAIKTILRNKMSKTMAILIKLKRFFKKMAYPLTYQLLPIAKKIRRSLNNRGIKHTALLATKRVAKKFRPQKRYAHPANISINTLSEYPIKLSEEKFKLLKAMFLPEFYLQQSGLHKNMQDQELFEHFISSGFMEGLSPSPLFDKEFYIAQLEKRGIRNIETPPLAHWLEYGVENQIVPTVLFDNEYFSERYKSSLKKGDWGFIRFLKISVYNNASPHKYFEPNWYTQHHNIKEASLPPFYHYLIQGSKIGWRPSALFPCFSREQCKQMPISPLEHVLKETGMHEIQDRLKNSDKFSKILNQVAKYAPEIHLPAGHKRINIPPYNTPIFPAIKNIRESLNESSYDSIVLIPHCRYGGAGLVAGEVCKALKNNKETDSVLLIRTDHDDFMRPDWFPDNIDIINLIDYCPDLPDVHRKKVLLDMLIGLKPKRILNIHSRLGWIVFEEFGDRLSHWSSLYGYTFCYDVDFLGKKVGYPIKYVPTCIDNMKSLFVDNTFIKDDLIKENNWDTDTANKIKVLKTPPQQDTSFTWSPTKKSENERKCVFWAGRFDKQKRFDLVIKIAKLCPNYDFFVWGKAMLGEDLDESKLPANILLQGLFKNFDEIPFNNCDAWLYTSQWDGIPTMLIELGMRGMPIVSSQVWGTAELITEDTAWPVKKITDISEYKNGLDHFISNQDDAKKKGSELKKLINTEHNSEKFSQSINKFIKDDTWRPAS